MERRDFLDRIRARLDGIAADAHASRGAEFRPHGMVPVEGVPEVGHPRRHEHPPTVLAETALAHNWNVRVVKGEHGLSSVVAEVIASEGARRVLVSRDPEVGAVAALLRTFEVEVVPWEDRYDPADADLGITGAVYGIAATGTIAVASGRAGGRAASLLVPVHLAVVHASRIVASASEVWRRMPERFPEGLPSQLVFISGPSRSADIEFTLTVGVHGPKRVWLAIIEDR